MRHPAPDKQPCTDFSLSRRVFISSNEADCPWTTLYYSKVPRFSMCELLPLILATFVLQPGRRLFLSIDEPCTHDKLASSDKHPAPSVSFLEDYFVSV